MSSEKIEQDIANALMEAASLRMNTECPEVRIKRGDKLLFTFKIGALTEDEWQKCRRQNLKNRGKVTEELDNGRFLSQVIYEATVDEDKTRLWKNKAVWTKLNAVNGIDVVGAVLTAAEKTKIVEAISDLSGYSDDLEDLIGNF